VANSTPLYIAGVTQKFSLKYFIKPGLFYPFSATFFVACTAYGLASLFRAYARASGALRNQLKYLCWSSLLGYLGGAANFFLVFDVEIIPWNPFGTYAVPLYVLVTTYAIVRYRLLDINVALARVAIFVSCYVPLLLAPIILANIMQSPLASWLGPRWWMVPMACEALVAVAGLSVYRAMTRRAEARLLAEQREYQELLVEAAHGMLNILSPQRLIALIARILMRHVKVTHVAVYFQEHRTSPYHLQTVRRGTELDQPIMAFDPDDALISYLRAVRAPVLTEELTRLVEEQKATHLQSVITRLGHLKAAVVVPSFLRHRLLGFLLLGPKRSGQGYSPEDLSVFQILADQAAIAIQHARFYAKSLTAETFQGIRQLLNAINHEMRNVLNVIATKLLPWYATPASPDLATVRTMLEGIQRALERGKRVTQEVKTYQDQMQAPTVKAYSPFRQLFQPLLAIPTELFPQRDNIRVALECPDDLPKIEGLPTVPELFRHLVTNACWALEASAEGGTITVRAHCPDRKNLTVQITDAGESLQPYLQHPEAMGGGAFFPERGKHGAIHYFLARQIAFDHGGALDVLTVAAGEGTRFEVRLPLVYTPPALKEDEEESGGYAAQSG